MSELTYLEKLNNIGLSIVGEFIGPAKKYHYTCYTCGNTHDGPSISAKLSSFAKFNSNGCPTCKHQKTLDKYQNIINTIKSIGIVVLQEYSDGKKIQVYRDGCGHTHDIDLGRYDRGQTTCPECGKHSQKGLITELTDNYISKMQQLNIKLVDKFTHRDEIHNFQCLTCNTIFSGVFNFKLNLDNPCPTCLRKHLSNQKIDNTYPDRLLSQGIKLLEPYKGAGKQHLMECLVCHHQWSTNPGSKIRGSKIGKHYGKCPICHERKKQVNFDIKYQQNIINLQNRGFEILEDNTDGRRSKGGTLVVLNKTCGHIFESNASNLYSAFVECPICNEQRKIEQLHENSKIKSENYAKTATAWRLYRSRVLMYTRKSLQTNNHIINPNNLPIGRAGIEGVHHTDHIVSMKWCFRNNVPVEICGHPDNLQTLGWSENISKHSKLPNIIPDIFVPFIN